MKGTGAERSAARERYFREIARAFLSRRGAPFQLSALDTELIAEWERAGIPLDVVLEGIESAFEPSPGRGRPRGRAASLSFCKARVHQAYDRHRDRRVGRPAPDAGGAGREAKRSRVREEIARFLAGPHAEAIGAAGPIREAESVLGALDPDEEALERLDEEVDRILSEGAPAEERQDAAVPPSGPLGEAERTRLVKYRREKYRVPRLALFYY